MVSHRINPRSGKRYDWEAEQARLNAAAIEEAELKKQILLLQRQQAILEARKHLLPFVKFTMPDPEDPNDVSRTMYEAAPFHEAIARELERVVSGEITQLIFCMPPRHGKTELATKRLAAWYSGKNPTHDIIVAAAGDDLASDFGSDVRANMHSPAFKQVFPDYRLRRGGNAKDNIQTEKGGRLIFAGRGGQINGRGAHCFPAGSMVETMTGPKGIENVSPGEKVLSYDIENRQVVWRNVQAIAVRPKARLYRLTTAAGRMVEVTGDHRFFAGNEWKETTAITRGDSLVCAVRNAAEASRVRDPEAFSSGPHEFLLLKRLLGAVHQHSAIWRTKLRALWRSCAAQVEFWNGAHRTVLLHESVFGSGSARRIGAANAGAHETVRAMQCDVHTPQFGIQVLRSNMRIESACQRDASRRKSALEGWGFCEPGSTACDPAFPGASAYGYAARRDEVRSVCRDRVERQTGQFGSSSHRRERDEQSSFKLDNAMPGMSRNGAFFDAERDAASTVEDTGRVAVVYDVQVEGTECFFVNGILAHNCLLIDDLYKDANEARSPTIRDAAWDWFVKVALYRRVGKRLTIITMTRWHSDDIIGRLTDPENPHYNEKEAASWKIIRLPGLAEADDPLGRVEGEALWPERRRDGTSFDVDYHMANQRRDPLGFAALTQQRPTVADGVLFRRENIQRYDPSKEMPSDMRFYAASDHAVGIKQRNDPSCFVKAGVDRQDNLWLTELFWERVPTDRAVEAMLTMGTSTNKPIIWWAERGHISQSIGPFLYKIMRETGRYLNVVEVTPVADKEQRAQSIAARVALGKVYVPIGPKWDKAVEELLAFPNGVHDDFCDALAHLGMGLQSQFSKSKGPALKKAATHGTFSWLKKNDKWIEEKKRAAALGGF